MYSIILLLLLTLPLSLSAQTPPHTPRGTNLVTNGNMNGTSGWFTNFGAVYDPSVSHLADGSGSCRIPAGVQGRCYTQPIAVSPNTTYTFGVHTFSQGWPPGMVWQILAAGDNSDSAQLLNMNSQENTWQEGVITFTTNASQTSLYLLIARLSEGEPGQGTIWVDDFYLGQGVGFAEPSVVKTPFNGAYTQVDQIGNISVLQGGSFVPFFPFCIYGDGRRPNYSQYYSDLGWNCNAEAAPETFLPAKNAVSTFNPNGLYSVWGITAYYGGFFAWQKQTFTNYWNDSKNNGTLDHVLWFYWDSESPWAMDFAKALDFSAHVHATDVTPGGQPMHPIFGFQHWGTGRYMRSSAGVRATDIHGWYQMSGYSQAVGGLNIPGSNDISQRIQGLEQPVVVYNNNIVAPGYGPGKLRQEVYNAFARGGRAITVWWDCSVGVGGSDQCAGAYSLDTVEWKADIPNLRREIDQMLLLLRTPNWTSWTVSHTGPSTFVVGPRDYQGKAHLIVLNASPSDRNVTFTLSGLPYTPTAIKNFFTGATVATPSGSSFTVTIPALGLNAGTAVLVVEGTVSNAPVITSAPTASGTTGTAFSYQITATNSPTSYGATGLPAGLSINTTSGLISGTPTSAGTFNVTLSATNADGTGQATLTLTIQAAPLPPGLYLHWRFDEPSGVTALDATSNNHPGTLQGAPDRIGGKVGPGAITFTGSLQNQWVQNTTLTWPAGQAFTAVMWINTPGGTQGGAFNIGGSTDRLGCHIPWSDNIIYCDHGPSTTTGRIATDFAPYVGKWTLVVFASNGTNFRAIYLNGVKAIESTSVNTPPGLLTGVEAGRYKVGTLPSAYHNGAIDEFQLYPTVLSDAEIAALYTEGVKRVPHRSLAAQ